MLLLVGAASAFAPACSCHGACTPRRASHGNGVARAYSPRLQQGGGWLQQFLQGPSPEEPAWEASLSAQEVVRLLCRPAGWTFRCEIGSGPAQAVGGTGELAMRREATSTIGATFTLAFSLDAGYDPPQGGVELLVFSSKVPSILLDVTLLGITVILRPSDHTAEAQRTETGAVAAARGGGGSERAARLSWLLEGMHTKHAWMHGHCQGFMRIQMDIGIGLCVYTRVQGHMCGHWRSRSMGMGMGKGARGCRRRHSSTSSMASALRGD